MELIDKRVLLVDLQRAFLDALEKSGKNFIFAIESQGWQGAMDVVEKAIPVYTDDSEILQLIKGGMNDE